MSKDLQVREYGQDAYGRAVLMTVFHHDWLEHRFDNLGFRAPIAQGCFMERLGGGAAASEGAHDEAGSTDLLIDDLTDKQIDALVWELRTHGAGAYRRGPSAIQGRMRTHLHYTLGADFPLSPMAQIIWNSYRTGGDGLAGPRPDYERRPNPLVLEPPEEDMTPAQMLEVLNSDAGQKAIAKAVWREKVVTDDAPAGRYTGSILQKLYNRAFPKK